MNLNLNKINPLNWSILISGGKENNHDFLSNGEWKGKTLKPKPRICVCGNAAQRCSVISWGVRSKHLLIALRKFKNGKTCLEEHSREGETPVRQRQSADEQAHTQWGVKLLESAA